MGIKYLWYYSNKFIFFGIYFFYIKYLKQQINLKSLNLNSNYLITIPEEFSKLNNLEVLLMNGNLLNNLPKYN